MNNWSFTGNLGKDCEKRVTPKGDSVTSFTVAVNSGFGDKQVTNWVNCALWGKQADALAPYLMKSTKVAISGELTLREYDNKDGSKGKSLDVRVSTITLIGSKPDSNTQASKESAPQSAKQAYSSAYDDFEQDIPFN